MFSKWGTDAAASGRCISLTALDTPLPPPPSDGRKYHTVYLGRSFVSVNFVCLSSIAVVFCFGFVVFVGRGVFVFKTCFLFVLFSLFKFDLKIIVQMD